MVKMDIVMKADENGDLTVIVGTPTLLNPTGQGVEPLSRVQRSALKECSDMILNMIEVWTKAESITKEGGQIQKADPTVVATNPISMAEFFINDMMHNPTNDWAKVRRKLLEAVSGHTFMELSLDEIDKAVKQ